MDTENFLSTDHIKKDVSFAPTGVFNKHYPNEAKDQAIKFQAPSWMGNLSEVVKDERATKMAEQASTPTVKIAKVSHNTTADDVVLNAMFFLFGLGTGFMICYLWKVN